MMMTRMIHEHRQCHLVDIVTANEERESTIITTVLIDEGEDLEADL